jgi:hypothetical protein
MVHCSPWRFIQIWLELFRALKSLLGRRTWPKLGSLNEDFVTFPNGMDALMSGVDAMAREDYAGKVRIVLIR